MLSDTLKTLLDLHVHRHTARGLDLKGTDLRGQPLAGLRADGLDLEEADLRESCLREVKWKGCILRDARLDSADFTKAVLRLCDLDQARAVGAIFVRTHLENSTARGARFDGADLTEAVLTDTDFSRASLRGANLESVEASGADFRGADLRGARLRNAVLVDCDLRGADLTNVDLTGADLRGADLRGVIGNNPALPKEANATAELSPELKTLSSTIAPIVAEVLQTAGRQGFMDAETTARLTNEVAALQQASSPKQAPHKDTLKAVTRVLESFGNDTVPRLFAAIGQPNQDGPPPEVRAMIRRLIKELALDDSATAEEVLERFTKGQ
jgi:uncharacterized protein YjbI with pentapeptide repeats